MDKWNNPIILRYLNYMGLPPIDALRSEANYLLSVTDQLKISSDFRGIDVDIISEFLGLKEENYNYSDNIKSSAHLIQSTPYNVEIELNSNISTFAYYKYRFIIAHEIGHWVIRAKINEDFTDEEVKLIDKYNFEEEILCHLFASELLMPSDFFVSKIKDEKLSDNLINRLYNIFKVPDYQILQRFPLVKDDCFGIFWEKKATKTNAKEELRVQNFFPDRRLKQNPFIPLNATVRKNRFFPNLILDSYNKKTSLTGKVYINNFGDLSGYYEVFSYNPNKNNIFDASNLQRKFDLITIFKKL